jgi:hypothetical protein
MHPRPLASISARVLSSASRPRAAIARVGAVLGQCHCDRAADSFGTAGDHRDFVFY